jgi:hypothetical protein
MYAGKNNEELCSGGYNEHGDEDTKRSIPDNHYALAYL